MTQKQKSIEEMYRELKAIVDRFEEEEVDLEKSLKEFRKGLVLAEKLKKRLSQLRNEIEEISAKNA